MNTSARAASLLLALMIATIGHAQSPPAKPKPAATVAPRIDFVTLDKDANSMLSREEAKMIADLDGAFAQLDSDHDASISPAEFSRWSRAGKVGGARPDPATAPSGSAGAQHMPDPK